MMYDMNHLQTLVMNYDNQESLHNAWTMVLSGLSTDPYPDILQCWYFKQLLNFKHMAEDTAHYKRAKYIDSPGPLL